MAQQGPAQPAAGQAAAQAAAAAIQVPPAYNQWRKTISDYTHHAIPCDGTNKREVRILIDDFDAMRRWTNVPENVCLTALGSLTRDVMRDGIFQFIQGHQGQAITWVDVRTYIQNAFLEDDEPEYQRKELERSSQGVFEGIKEYSNAFQKALGRAYTHAQLQDPVHLARVIGSYIRGINLGEVREKVYDSQPVTLLQAMERAHTFSVSKKLRAEKNGPRLEDDVFPTPAPRRREEAMDVGYLTHPAPFPLLPPKQSEPLGDRFEGLDKKLKTLQKQLTALLKTQEKQGEEMKQFLQRNTDDQNRRGWNRLQDQRWGPPPPPPPDRYGNAPRNRQGNPSQDRQDRRKWDDNGKPYCLRCGALGHMIRECAALGPVDGPTDQGN